MAKIRLAKVRVRPPKEDKKSTRMGGKRLGIVGPHPNGLEARCFWSSCENQTPYRGLQGMESIAMSVQGCDKFCTDQQLGVIIFIFSLCINARNGALKTASFYLFFVALNPKVHMIPGVSYLARVPFSAGSLYPFESISFPHNEVLCPQSGV